MRAENKFSEAKQEKKWPFLSDATLNLMLNDWINELSKKTALISFGNYAVCFVSWSDVCLFLFFNFSRLYWPNARPASSFPVGSVHNGGKNVAHLFWKWRILMSLDCVVHPNSYPHRGTRRGVVNGTSPQRFDNVAVFRTDLTFSGKPLWLVAHLKQMIITKLVSKFAGEIKNSYWKRRKNFTRRGQATPQMFHLNLGFWWDF